MSLYSQLAARAEAGNPVRAGLIGAGKFGTMFLAQARRTPGLHVMAVADLSLERAREACRRAGWPDAAFAAADFAAARSSGATFLTEDALALAGADGIDVVIDSRELWRSRSSVPAFLQSDLR